MASLSRFCCALVLGRNRHFFRTQVPALSAFSVLPSLWQQEWHVAQQSRLQRQLLEFDSCIGSQREEHERELNGSESSQHQQSVQRFFGASCAALANIVWWLILIIKTLAYTLTRAQLLHDLYVAFYDAARHKHKMSYVVKFERNLKNNLDSLCTDLLTHQYVAQPSTCFVVDYPKKREVFAAMFRDRVVHHLYFNYTHQMFERTFIADSYSCIKGRGTLYGVNRLTQHIRQVSQNYAQPCYVMNIDIRGYFMHINRATLTAISTQSLKNMSTHRIGTSEDIGAPSGVMLTPHTTWSDVRDMNFILWLTKEIAMLDPMKNCIIVGDEINWEGMDKAKSMRYVAPGLALPIGNLTSQLFSNVYLNEFDQYVKRTLHCTHYGRYVDDAAIVSADRDWLLQQVPILRNFLLNHLGLQMHMGKLHIRNAYYGVEFLGTFIKPWRNYVSNKTLRRMRQHMAELQGCNQHRIQSAAISYMGVLSHTASHNIAMSKPKAA